MDTIHSPDDLLTINEVTAELRISRSTWCKLVREGNAPPIIRLGGAKRIRRGAVTAWLREREAA